MEVIHELYRRGMRQSCTELAKKWRFSNETLTVAVKPKYVGANYE